MIVGQVDCGISMGLLDYGTTIGSCGKIRLWDYVDISQLLFGDLVNMDYCAGLIPPFCP